MKSSRFLTFSYNSTYYPLWAKNFLWLYKIFLIKPLRQINLSQTLSSVRSYYYQPWVRLNHTPIKLDVPRHNSTSLVMRLALTPLGSKCIYSSTLNYFSNPLPLKRIKPSTLADLYSRYFNVLLYWQNINSALSLKSLFSEVLLVELLRSSGLFYTKVNTPKLKLPQIVKDSCYL